MNVPVYGNSYSDDASTCGLRSFPTTDENQVRSLWDVRHDLLRTPRDVLVPPLPAPSRQIHRNALLWDKSYTEKTVSTNMTHNYARALSGISTKMSISSKFQRDGGERGGIRVHGVQFQPKHSPRGSLESFSSKSKTHSDHR